MNMTEVARFLLGLRAAGWSEKEINDFMLYIESGEEQYKPKPREKKADSKTGKSVLKNVLPSFSPILPAEYREAQYKLPHES